jgi:hypothetical protein
VGFWRANIGSLEEFWALTPREVYEIVECFWRQQDLNQMRFGTLGAIAINLKRQKKHDKVRKWRDICPPFTKSNKKRGLTLEEMLTQTVQMQRDMYPWKR